jgi:hypothetical protein
MTEIRATEKRERERERERECVCVCVCVCRSTFRTDAIRKMAEIGRKILDSRSIHIYIYIYILMDILYTYV